MNELPSPDPAPFPMGSVQAVAARSWRMCVREDPVGLLAIPYLIAFPVFAFLTILTAAITTSFIERARSQRQAVLGHEDPVIARLDDIAERLDRLERRLAPGDD